MNKKNRLSELATYNLKGTLLNENDILSERTPPMYLKAMADWMWENWRESKSGLPDDFDYPDYGGMPEKLYKRLSSDLADVIQSELYDFGKSAKNRYKETFKTRKKTYDWLVRQWRETTEW